VSALAAEAGLPMLPSEALIEHIHAHLELFYEGQAITVPANLGIDYSAGRISPLHTHDATGIIHIESPEVKPYYLGQFLTEWGLQNGSGCLAGQCPPAHPVAVYVNGSPSPIPLEKVEITAHAEIAVVVGTPPATIPKSYSFPSGY